MNPDRRRLRRGETVEVSSPSSSLDIGPRLRERPLGRCHTLDSGEPTPEPTYTQSTTEHTPPETNRRDVTHTLQTAGCSLPADVLTSTDTDNTQPDATETHSTEDCSTRTESRPSSPSKAPSHTQPTHTATDYAASQQPASSRLRPLNGQLQPSANQIQTETEAMQAESEDEDLSPTCSAELHPAKLHPAELHPAVQTDVSDQEDSDHTPETNVESNHEGCEEH